MGPEALPKFELAGLGWLEARIESVADLISYLTWLLEKAHPRYPGQTVYAFRGQSKAEWPLTPTLLRRLPTNVSEADALVMEDGALQDFMAQAHLHLDAPLLPPASLDHYLVSWWSQMQHHFAPSRLLDWTASPFVAAYFAASEYLNDPGAIWFVHCKRLTNAARKRGGILKGGTNQASYFRGVDHPQIVEPLHPRLRANRMVAQQGLFTVSRNIMTEHSRGILDTLQGPQGAVEEHEFSKLIIPGEIKRELRSRLRYMNLTAASLFPGVDGLGRSVTESVELFETRP